LLLASLALLGVSDIVTLPQRELIIALRTVTTGPQGIVRGALAEINALRHGRSIT
jgi:hypothetical protein